MRIIPHTNKLYVIAEKADSGNLSEEGITIMHVFMGEICPGFKGKEGSLVAELDLETKIGLKVKGFSPFVELGRLSDGLPVIVGLTPTEPGTYDESDKKSYPGKCPTLSAPHAQELPIIANATTKNFIFILFFIFFINIFEVNHR